MRLSDQFILRAIIGAGILYLVILVGTVAITSLKYRDFYAAPKLDHSLSENEVLQLWQLNYEQGYREYKRVVQAICFGLALYLPIWAAALGFRTNSVLKGLIGLGCGAVVTLMALSILPWIYFPFDKYPVAMLWIIGAVPWLALSWAVLTFLGRVLRQRGNQNPTLA